jgi:hypothetical protein
MMKRSSLLLPALLAAMAAFLLWACSACSRQNSASNSIVRIHFAGAANISSDTNSVAFENEFYSPEARALESQTLDKLSRAPGVWFKDKLPSGVGDGSAQLRPLLDDFLKSEWVFEMADAPQSPEYALAIRLDSDREQFWQTNLRYLLESWTKITAQTVPGGWELKKDMPPNLFRVVRAGNWLVIGCGQDELPLSDQWAGEGIPSDETNWLSADLDWPRLAQIFPAFAKFDFPGIKMQITGNNGNLQLTGQFNLGQPLPILDKWQIPTNIIHQPLTSFTAVRGFAPWLENQKWAKTLEISPEPDQLFIWSLGLMPLQTFIAAPVSNATNALAQLGKNLVTYTNWQSDFIYHTGVDITANRVAMTNVPFVAPEVVALQEKSGDFLFADVFPNIPQGKAPPQELLQAFDQDNLVFYQWEKTSERLKVLPQLTQLVLMLNNQRQLDLNSTAAKWLNLIGPTLGICTTEVTKTGPQELAFTRKAPAGLTAFELITLANWLEAPNFPRCDLSLPPMRFTPLHKPVKKLSAPATLPPAKH